MSEQPGLDGISIALCPDCRHPHGDMSCEDYADAAARFQAAIADGHFWHHLVPMSELSTTVDRSWLARIFRAIEVLRGRL